MRKTLPALFLISLLITGPFFEARAARGFVGVAGRDFTAPGGEKLFLKGINLGNWLLPEGYMFNFKTANSPRLIGTLVNELIGEQEAAKFWREYRDNYITREDIHLIKSAGFNSVRVPFNYRLFVSGEAPQKFEGAGYELLDRVVKWCAQEGLYVVLDMHAAPGGQTGDNIDDSWGYPFLFESAEAQELTVRLWEKLAQRYRNEPAIIGYDLLNEPIAHYFDTASLNPKLEPLYRRIVQAIRRFDPNHIIFLGGAQWDSNFKVFGPPFDPKLAYTFHKYWTNTDQSVIQEYLDFSRRHNVPLWMGESGENTSEWIGAFRATLEKNGVSWCFWPYKKMDAPSCVASISRPAEWETIAAYANQPRATFEEVRTKRPPRATIDRALSTYLENIKLKNCKINRAYLEALGLKAPGS